MIEGQSDAAFYAGAAVSASESVAEVDSKAFCVSYPMHTLRSLLFSFHHVLLGDSLVALWLSHQCRSPTRQTRRVPRFDFVAMRLSLLQRIRHVER